MLVETRDSLVLDLHATHSTRNASELWHAYNHTGSERH
jgi:hypothetical protein